MGRITEPIQPQAFEIIRDRIFEIIADELYQQAAINYDDELDANVYLERAVPINQSECPAVNIYLTQGSYLDESKNTARGEYTYAVDIYTKASSVAGTRGDLIASERMGRIMGAIRAIIMDHNYITLQFARPFIENVRVEGFSIANPSETKDAANMILGRLLIKVRATQSVQNYPPSTLDGYDTQVQISESAQGYLYSGNNVTPAEPVCPGVSLLINTVSFADVSSGATFDITVVDTNGDNPVVSISGSTVTVTAAGGDDVTTTFNGVATGVDTPAGSNISIAALNSTPALVGTLTTNTGTAKGITIGDSNISNSDDSYSVNVAAENDLELPDITHTDTDGSPVILPAQTPMICSAGSTVKPSRSYTGILTSNDTGDDAYNLAAGLYDGGVLQSFYKMFDGAFSNGYSDYSHNFRFVGKTGGYFDGTNFRDVSNTITTESLAYPDDILFDQYTGYSWYRERGSITTRTACFSEAAAATWDGETDWFIPSLKMIQDVINMKNVASFINGELFASFNTNIWSSSPYAGSPTTQGWYIDTLGRNVVTTYTQPRAAVFARKYK